MSGRGDCLDCRDTGREVELQDRTPHAPVPSYVRITGYCRCSAGKALRAADKRHHEASMQREAEAREYVWGCA